MIVYSAYENISDHLSPMYLCPKFDWCSSPICFLDVDMKSRNRLSGEDTCTLSKSKRLRLGKDLPWKGLNPREISALKSWEKLDPRIKSERKERLRDLIRPPS